MVLVAIQPTLSAEPVAGLARWRTLATLLTVCIVTFGSPQRESVAGSPPFTGSGTTRPQDEFWIASTRAIPSMAMDSDTAPPVTWRRWRADDATWSDSSAEEFFAASKHGINTFYIPGNRVANEEAESRAWSLYSLLASASDDEPLRMVVWSWPSDRVQGSKTDFRVKANRTVSESLYLGWVLGQFSDNERVSLVGYSYGARIISGALHVASGGEIEGIHITPKNPPRMRTVLMASATPNQWMLPGQFHQNAVSRVDQMLVLYNHNDVALKHFHMIEEYAPRALGYCGFDASRLQSDADRVHQRNVQREVGMTHYEIRYYTSCRILDEIRRYALWGPTNPELTAPKEEH